MNAIVSAGLSAASSLYGAVASRRRAWYVRSPDRQRRLRQPVISVGNLSVGGSGKTPVVAHLARMLQAFGERPAILSRGYGRRVQDDGVTVVSDGTQVRADFDHAGDEPLMLARALPGVPVVVASERHLAGRLAESQLGATVHLLDDGFQHVQLWRDINLLVIDAADLTDHVLPAGRLREPLSAAHAADAVLTTSDDAGLVATVRAQLGVTDVFPIVRRLDPVRMLSSGTIVEPATVGPVFAAAGIARPQRFLDDLAAAGWHVAGSLLFRDHHRFRPADVMRLAEAARDAQTHVIVTTEKDAVRLEGLNPASLALAVAPLSAAIVPADLFAAWLRERLGRARLPRSPLERVDRARPLDGGRAPGPEPR